MNSRAHHLNVGRVVKETADAVSLVFDVPDDVTGRFVYSPGQFLTLRVPSEQTGSVARCYSLSSSSHGDEQLSVTVKRTAGGYASNWICVNVVRPYADRDVFLCGPAGFVAVTQSAMAALQVSPSGIHREEYRSLETNPFEAAVAVAPPAVAPVRRDGGVEVEVELDGETHVLAWPKGKKLLDVLLDAGLDPPYVCRESACGTCVCSVKEGKTRMVMNESLIDEDLDMGLTLACQTLPESERVHIAFDQ